MPHPRVSPVEPPFVVDLHAHFPMQFDADQSFARHFASLGKRRRRANEPFADKVKFAILSFADKYFNRAKPTAGHAVTIDTLHRGNVGLALSVAYLPFEELDLGEPYASPPHDDYFGELHRLLRVVEDKVRDDPTGHARVVRTFAEFQAARDEGKVALVHAVEGGFHVGASDGAIATHVEKLAALGAGYVTIAHLFWRQVSTNVPALPFLPDAIYRMLFPQPADVGLGASGRALVRELVRRGVLVDLTHMSESGMRDTFALLDEIDPKKTIPVIATHIACSFGKYAYNMKREWVERIAERKGVTGIIYCDHYLRDGRGKETKTFEASLELVHEQIATLRSWGGDDVLAIGSDLDGFIKPTLAGIESAANHRDVARALVDRYGEALAAKICHGNALRVFESAWMRPFPRA